METKKEDKAKTVAMPKAAEPKNQTAAPKAVESKRAEKTQSIAEILDAQLKEIQRKKQLADNRDIFLSKRKSLKDYQKLLRQLALDNVFETEDFSLSFMVKQDYRNSNNFTISNPEMLLKFVVFLGDEIDKAVQRIEAELLRDIA